MNFAPHRSAASLLTLLCLPALLPMLGCGTAEYQEEVNRAMARLKIDNQFKILDTAPTVLAAWKGDQGPIGTKVTFRKPSVYNVQPFNATSMNPGNPAEPLRPERLKPPFLQNFPGFAQAWEKTPIAGRNDSVAVLYVGAQAAEPGVNERVLGELKAAFPDLPDLAWRTVDVLTPEGKTVRWNALSFDHEQEFMHMSEPLKIQGSFLLLQREEQGRQVFIGSRWSDTAGDLNQRKQDIQTAAGTVQVAVGVKID